MPSLVHAVTEALGGADVQPRDGAAVALALEYAQAIDADPLTLPDLGPKLLATLTALGMTPVGRGAKGGAAGAVPLVSKLDELRARREKRAGLNGTPALDAAAS